jgi:hypothetical protein
MFTMTPFKNTNKVGIGGVLLLRYDNPTLIVQETALYLSIWCLYDTGAGIKNLKRRSATC